MVEWVESKGEIFLWNKGNKVKFSSLGYIAKTMNTQTEFEVQENTSMIAGDNNRLVAKLLRIDGMYWDVHESQ